MSLNIRHLFVSAETQEDANKIHLYHVGTWYGEDHMEWNDNDGLLLE